MDRLTVSADLRSAVIPPLVLQSRTLTPEERLCIGILAMYGEVSFPARTTIASMMGCSIATVARTLSGLRRKRWLLVEPRIRSDGGRTSNRYHLCDPRREAQSAVPPPSQDEVGGQGQDESGPPSQVERGNSYTGERVDLIPDPEVGTGTRVPVPDAGRPRPLRKYPPHVYEQAKAFAHEFRADQRQIEGRLAPETYGRDLGLACKLVAALGVEDVRKMAKAFMRYREGRSRLVSMSEFYRVREHLFHEITKGVPKR